MPISVSNHSTLVARLRLSSQENIFYTRLFVEYDKTGCGLIRGDVARDLFRSSGLSDDLLFAIWGVGDSANVGELDFAGFCICCRLIAYAQTRGINCIAPGGDYSAANIEATKLFYKDPKTLPTFGLHNGEQSIISEADIDLYRRTFDELDVDGDGYIQGDDAKRYYTTITALECDELMHIWSMADATMDGLLSFDEFCVMQHLVGVAMQSKITNAVTSPVPTSTTLYVENSQNFPPKVRNQKHNSIIVANGSVDELLDHATIIADEMKSKIDVMKEQENALSSEKNKTKEELIVRLQELDALLIEYRQLKEAEEAVILENNLLREKLSVVQEQIEHLHNDIEQLKQQNAFLTAAFEANDESISNLDQERAAIQKQAQEELALLKLEERQLGILKNTLDQLNRQKQKLHAQGNTLKECLAHSENAAKTMSRAVEKQHGNLANIRNERINILQQRCKLSESANSIVQEEYNNNVKNMEMKAYNDANGIRVSKLPSFPTCNGVDPRFSNKEGQMFPD